MTNEIDNLSRQVNVRQLFSKPPEMRFVSDKKICECGEKLKVLKTREKKVVTMEVGKFIAHETIMHGEDCGKKYYSEDLRALVPVQGVFGFDVIVYVGEALYLQHRSDTEVQSLLAEKNISISLREVAYLGKKFITYLTITHQESSEKIKNHIRLNGGYILHLDGTCEGGSPHLFSSMDGLNGIILHNIKVPSENSKYLIPFLKDIESRYGAPIGVVSDMSNAIIKAVETVFVDVNIYVCHFHFLRDIGKDLASKDYNSIRKILSEHKIYAALRKIVRELKCIIDEDKDFQDDLDGALKNKQWENLLYKLPAVVSTYMLVAWVLEAKKASHGYGFPFDQPHVDFYKRLIEACPVIEKLKGELIEIPVKLPMTEILRIRRDIALEESVVLIDEKISLFNNLRKAMRITMLNGKNGLNDEGNKDIKSTEKGVMEFRNSDQLKRLTDMVARKKMEEEIDKYQDKLFADPINVETDNGTVQITPQRTNNPMEQSFRIVKRGGRKKSGTASLSKMMESMSPNMALISNLTKPDYMKNIMNGKESLAERFSEIDHKLILEEMRKEDELTRKYHKGMGKLFKIQQLPDIIRNNLVNRAVGE